MNWQTELNSSISWIFTALFWLVISLSMTAFVLKQCTFGRKFSLIIQPCLQLSHRGKTLVLLLILLTLILIEVRISVLNSFFYNGLYSALQKQDANAFWFFACINAALVGFKIIHAIVDYLTRQIFEIRWLEKLNRVMLNRWLDKKNYYRLKYKQTLPDNIEQRIEQDSHEFITGTVNFLRGLIDSIISTIEFTFILWQLSGILVLFGVNIPKGVVFFIYIFILIATALSIWIGYPLIKLNFLKEKLNGDYRYSLIRVRDHAESIAFYHGETKERSFLQQKFNAIIDNRWAIVRRMIGLDGFNTGVTQVAMILPLILQAPRFFTGQVTLGDMHQTVQSFNRLMRALSFFRLFYEEFTLYQARLNRLAGFITSLDELDQLDIQQPINCSHYVRLHHFGVKDPDGNILLQDINIALNYGEALLIKGPSGAGKTTLLKAIAGIYPFETLGYAEYPCCGTSLFLPQRPYTPEGTLRDAICYPQIQATDNEIIAAMQACRLSKYCHALRTESDWQVNLSPGELQRIAFIRILLTKPDVIFLDETTSALDEPTEYVLYNTIKKALPHAIIISVGHRSTLNQFHQKHLKLTQRY